MNKYKGLAKKAKKAYKKYRSCDRKAKFLFRKSAEETGNKVYRCKFCGFWHTSGQTKEFYFRLGGK